MLKCDRNVEGRLFSPPARPKYQEILLNTPVMRGVCTAFLLLFVKDGLVFSLLNPEDVNRKHGTAPSFYFGAPGSGNDNRK